MVQSHVRARLLVGLAVLAALLAVAACAPATAIPGPAATSAPATQAPEPTAAQPSGGKASLPAGVDADGNFYRGDPKAPVKLVEYSDFQ